MRLVRAPNARFERIRPLGEGANGVVYEAVDRERGTRVALKTLRYVSGQSLARLEREFRTIQRVRHPNLVALGELVTDGPQVFFTMELVEGTDFLQGVRVGETSFDDPRLRETLRQLAAALCALHDAGFVHRDIKPSNVRVTRDGRVVVLDFDLVAEVGSDDAWNQFEAGTPAYMAPEQAVSAHVGPEADWYAMGVMMFEALTGKAPFEGPPLQILTRKQRDEPPPPSSLAGGVPTDLDSLCAALLAFDPDARPNGMQVLRALRRRTTSRPADDRASWRQEAPFVGRSVELDVLREGLRDSRSGAPTTIIVEGESGQGKSALVNEFLRLVRLEAPDAVAISARCFEDELAPFRGVRGLVDALAEWLTRIDPVEVRTLVPSEPLALVHAFPVLKRVESIAELSRGPLPPFAPWGLRSRAFGLLRELLRRVSERRPLVLAIDDAQWVDDDSLALLSELTRAPDSPRALLVLVVEPPAVEVSRKRPAVGAQRKGRSLADLNGAVRRIHLEAMAEVEVSGLASELLEATAHDNPARTPEALAQLARGDVLLLDQITREGSPLAFRSGTKLEFEELLNDSILKLDGETRAMLETSCVAGAPIALEILGRAVGLEGRPELLRGISRLSQRHLVAVGGARGARVAAPYHDRVRSTVLWQLDERRRIEIHRNIAKALERSDRPDPGPLSTHWFAAQDFAQARHYAILAGDEANEQLAFDCAARFYERALSSGKQAGDEKRSLLVKLGNARANAGWGQRAASAFRRAAKGATPTEALQLRRRAAEELLMAGEIEGGTSVLRGVLARLGMWMPSSPLATLLAFLFLRALLHLRGMRPRSRDGARVPQEALARLNVCWVVARVLGSTDRLMGAYFATRLLLLALRYPEPNVLSGALALEAAQQAAKGIRTKARVEGLLARAEAIGVETSAPFAKVAGPRMRGLVAYLQGRFAEALELNDRATARILEVAPDEYFAMRQTQLYSLWALAVLGEIKELSTRLTRALREATDRHDVETISVLRWGLFAPAWLREGNPGALRAAVAEAMRPWANRPYNGHHHFTCSALAQIDLYEGRGREAFERLAADFPRAQRAFRFNVEISHVGFRQLRGRAAVLAAAQASPGEDSLRRRFLACAQADARWVRRAPPAYAKAWAAGVEAGIAGVMGKREQAVAALQESLAGLEAVSDRFSAAAVRMRLGQLLGAQGQAHYESGAAYMEEQGVADPLRMAALLVPGLDEATRPAQSR